mmetsp:Transcript_16313/g.35283  ORF Transcript_16313/g.35283 Transcript_16313/m.35283 type:complete len:188 (+) Transcript_16313:46-609(+)
MPNRALAKLLRGRGPLLAPQLYVGGLQSSPNSTVFAGATDALDMYCMCQVRNISEEKLNEDGDQVADLFARNLAKASRKREDAPGPRILTTRREALHLYREILRYSNLFVWKDDNGHVWRDVLRQSARKEFEDARHETDPEILNKLIITGRDCVQRTVEVFMKRRQSIIDDEAAKQGQGRGGYPHLQ